MGIRSSKELVKRRRLLASTFGTLLLVAMMTTTFLTPRAASAQWTTFDVNQLATFVWEKIQAGAEWAWEHGAAIAFKNAARTFTTRIAYDTAVMLASGGQGQTPLLSWRTLGQTAQRAADDAAGDFLETLDTQNGFVRLGICQPPRASFQAVVGLSLFDEIAPRQPRCSLSSIENNWETFFADPDKLLERFGVVFDPRQNDLGVAITLRQTLIQEQSTKTEIAKLEQLMNQGFNSINEPITGFIKTPAGQIRDLSRSAIEASTQDFSTFTGDIVADALGVFTNTLASRLMKRLLQGSIPSPSRLESGQFGLGNLGLGGVEYAVQINSNINTPQLVGSTNTVDVISEFSNCPQDPAYFTPLNACTITQKFAQALRKADEGTALTVQEAINQGYIDGSLKFALIRSSDDQKAPTKAWYLSDIRKLRRARIIPLGWELAAEQFAGTNVTLQQVMGSGPEYTNGFNTQGSDEVCGTPDDVIMENIGVSVCGLVDPNWVLRAPPAQCRIEAFGQQLEPQGSNRQKTCVDYQHCIAEKADGSCQSWGYCTREQNIWRFSGKTCEFPEGSGSSPWGTCMSFKDPAGKSNNYLSNSLVNYDDGVCTDGASCRWYSVARSTAPTGDSNKYLSLGTQADVNTVDFNLDTAASAPRFYLKNVAAKKCGPNEEGCTQFLQLSGINTEALGLPPTTPLVDQVQAAVTAVTAGTFASYEQISSSTSTTLKHAPDYLNCYDASLSNDAPECASYLKLCYENEVGCELYTPQDGSPAVPGKVEAANTCPAECSGFNTYTQASAFFENYVQRNEAEPENNFIPTSAKVCSAEYAGCEEFTNVEQNERKEYYTEMRQCVRPEDGLDNTYYTWVGSDLTGYQLKTWQLQAVDPNNELSAPFTTDSSGDCLLNNQTNPDCKQFYATSGSQVQVHYRLESKVIYSSTSCNRYRATSIAQADCGISNGSWENGFCFYRAIPNQGKVCSAAANGCREYRGPTANNVRLVFPISTFGDSEPGVNADSSPLSGWIGGTNSTESTSAFGHSLASGDDRIITKDISNSVTEGKQYIMTFWAKQDDNLNQTRSESNIFAQLFGVSEAQAQVGHVWDFGTFSPTNEWAIYSLGPVTLPYDASGGNQIMLNLIGSQKYFIDNIAFREVQDTFFVRKNTWVTPTTCNATQLHCSAYRTRTNQVAYLKSFDTICRNEAVGCQALVNTHNSTSPQEQTYVAGDQTVVVPEDDVVFRIYDTKKSCNAKFAGCKRVGQPITDSAGVIISWSDVFTVLNPNAFDPEINGSNSPLCSSEQNMCQVYTDSAGVPHYFKNPENRLCEYKLLDSTVGYAWYKQGTNERCNLINNPSFELLTSGVTDDDYADIFNSWIPVAGGGVLEAISSFNGKYWGSTVARVPTTADGVRSSTVSFVSVPGQERVIAAYAWVRVPTGTTLGAGGINISADFSASNVLGLTGTTYSFSDAAAAKDTWMLLTRVYRTTNLSSFTVRVNAASAIGDVYVDQVQAVELSSSLSNGQAVDLAKVPYAYQCPSNQVGCTAYKDPELTKKTYYYLNNDSLDKGTCNGQVSEKEGCLLFSDLSSANLTYDASATYTSSQSQNNKLVAPLGAVTPEVDDTNLILKVNRDRTCAEWLACQSESPRLNPQTNRYDSVCYALGTCNQIGATNESANRCASWVNKPTSEIVPLEKSVYQRRGNDWSSQEYSGYSLPYIYPVEKLSQKEYRTLHCGGKMTGAICTVLGSTEAPCTAEAVCSLVSDIRLTYLNPEARRCGGTGSLCNNLPLGSSAAPCSLTATCQLEDLGMRGGGIGGNLENTNAKLCRAYPQQDSPFPEGVVKEYGSACAGPEGSGCPSNGSEYYLEVPKSMESAFKEANACQFGDVCECSYQRVAYRNGDNLFYSFAKSPLPSAYAIDADQETGMILTRMTKVDNNIGLKGYCLEKDPSRLINAKSDIDQACLTWLPVDVVSGEVSLYDYSPEAGFVAPVNRKFYCSYETELVNNNSYNFNIPNLPRYVCLLRQTNENNPRCAVIAQVSKPSPRLYDLPANDWRVGITSNPGVPTGKIGQCIGWGAAAFDVSGECQDGNGSSCVTNYINQAKNILRDYYGTVIPYRFNSRCWGQHSDDQPQCQTACWDNDSMNNNDCDDDDEYYTENSCYYAGNNTPNGGWNINSYYNFRTCNTLVQTTDAGGANKAWTSRLASGSTYIQPALSYGIDQRCGYFGATVVDNISSMNNKSPLFMSLASQPAQNSCNYTDSFFTGGAAYSVNNSDEGVVRLRELFAKTYSLYNWNLNSYISSSTPPDYSNSPVNSLRAPTSSQPGVPIEPQVRQVLFDEYGKPRGESGNDEGFSILANGQYYYSGNIPIDSSQAVTVFFYAYNPNGEQMPLKKVFIDWGDGSPLSGAISLYKNHKFECKNANNPEYNFGDSSKACVGESTVGNGYFSYTHVYTSAGTFTPRLYIEDNWEWCAQNNWKCQGASSSQTTPPVRFIENSAGWLDCSINSNCDVVVSAPPGGGGGGVSGPMGVAPSSSINACGLAGGPFSPASQLYLITNTGSASMAWSVTDNAAWLNVTPSSGTLAPGAGVTVTALINSQANSLGAGTYGATLTFTNVTSGTGGGNRSFNLTVASNPTQCGGIIYQEQ